MENETFLARKLAGGRLMTLKERDARKKRNRARRKRDADLLKKAGHVEARTARLSDFKKRTAPLGETLRVHQGGYLAPSVELNALAPLQVGYDVPGAPSGGFEWYMRSHPAMVIRPEDMTLETQPVTGITTARAQVIIAYPYADEYAVTSDALDLFSNQAFNHVDPSGSMSPACLCFYGDGTPPDDSDDDVVELQDPDPELGTGTVRAPGIYNEEWEDSELTQCSSPKRLPMDAFSAHGRLIIIPHPDADYTDFLISVRDGQGRVIGTFTRFIASRSIFGPASAVYGETELGLDDHTVGGSAYGHNVALGRGGSGPRSDSDGLAGRNIARDVTKIAPNAGPAIIDVSVKYPLSVRTVSNRLITLDAWGTRIR
ncbi:hypothetical protein Z949_1855 [Sulfitobacter guttiformis KCTC 32187]|nr:hypothetical protein Z949_1855 [Sulfitobacter guttiformis KCTC 32187]